MVLWLLRITKQKQLELQQWLRHQLKLFIQPEAPQRQQLQLPTTPQILQFYKQAERWVEFAINIPATFGMTWNTATTTAAANGTAVIGTRLSAIHR